MGWSEIISSVKRPLGFYALALLITALLLYTVLSSSLNQDLRFYLAIFILLILIFVIVIFTLLVWKKPINLVKRFGFQLLPLVLILLAIIIFILIYLLSR